MITDPRPGGPPGNSLDRQVGVIESTTTPLRPEGPEPSFQFTLQQLFLFTLGTAVLLALIFHWGVVGLVIAYSTICLLALGWGIVRASSTSLIIGAGMLLFAFCIVFPMAGIVDGRTPARRASCSNNLKNIALALQQYHTNFGCYPPPYIADAKGKPLHSWRVLLLPYLEQKALHKQYRFDEPWDGPNNRKLHNIAVKIFACPSQDDKTPRCETNYVAVIGPKTAWPGGNSAIKDSDIIDGLSNTLLLTEVANSGIHWMEPRDLHVNQMATTINAPRGQGISSHHPGGAHLTFADGAVRYFTNNTPPETIRNFLTRNGKEPPP
jgi:prepilin-type processing-associated H-X9-DG protein